MFVLILKSEKTSKCHIKYCQRTSKYSNQVYLLSFYQIQQTMFTPNKKKSRHSKLVSDSFETSDFIELFPSTQPLKPKPLEQGDKQNIAKHALLQIGQLEFGTSDKNTQKSIPLSIDSWVGGHIKVRNPLRAQKLNESNFTFVRNARSVTACFTKQKEEEEENTVLKLKEALKKLQSPQKPKSNKKRSWNQNKNEILSSLMSKRKIETKVSDLIRLKQCENLKMNGSSNNNFNYRKISTSMQNRIKKIEPPIVFGEPLCTKRMGQTFNFNYKQARKNRTLKGILH